MIRRLVYCGVAVAGLAIAAPAVAWAHARLTKSEPADQAKLTTAPTAIRLWYSEAPEIAFTSVVLSDSTHAVIATSPMSRGASKFEATTLIRRPLGPGRYTIAWRTAASDGHPSSGQLTFSVLAAKQGVHAPTKKP